MNSILKKQRVSQDAARYARDGPTPQSESPVTTSSSWRVEASDTRARHIFNLKQALANHTYRVSPAEIAERILRLMPPP